MADSSHFIILSADNTDSHQWSKYNDKIAIIITTTTMTVQTEKNVLRLMNKMFLNALGNDNWKQPIIFNGLVL